MVLGCDIVERATPLPVKWPSVAIHHPKCYRNKAGFITHLPERNTITHIHQSHTGILQYRGKKPTNPQHVHLWTDPQLPISHRKSNRRGYCYLGICAKKVLSPPDEN